MLYFLKKNKKNKKNRREFLIYKNNILYNI